MKDLLFELEPLSTDLAALTELFTAIDDANENGCYRLGKSALCIPCSELQRINEGILDIVEKYYALKGKDGGDAA